MAVPDWFALGPSHAPLLGDGGQVQHAELLKLLTHGRPFPPDVAQRLLTICGHPLTAGGFEEAFAPLLPSATWVVSQAEPDGPGVAFLLSAMDRRGQVVFEVGVNMCFWTTGAVEGFTYSADVSPDHRGLGITARGEQLQANILRALSQHPDSRLTLRAGYMTDANTGAMQPSNGALVHASRGYLFADSMDAVSPFSEGPETELQEPNEPVNDCSLLIRRFHQWVGEDASICIDGKPADEAQRAALMLAAQTCSQPYDFLRLGGESATALAATPGQQPTPLKLGKAFFLADRMPVWCGVRYVNPPASSTPAAQRRLRMISQSIFSEQTARELASARRRSSAFTQKVYAQFIGADPKQRAESYLAMAMHGHPELEKRLRDRFEGPPPYLPARWCRSLAKERDPRARKALEAALHLFKPGTLSQGLQQAANNQALPLEVREAMAARLQSLEGSYLLQPTG